MLKPEFAANAVLSLAHTSCPTTGGLYQTEGGTIRKLRMQASSGLVYDPESAGALEKVSHRWDETADFSEHTFPAESGRGQLPTVTSRL